MRIFIIVFTTFLSGCGVTPAECVKDLTTKVEYVAEYARRYTREPLTYDQAAKVCGVIK